MWPVVGGALTAYSHFHIIMARYAPYYQRSLKRAKRYIKQYGPPVAQAVGRRLMRSYGSTATRTASDQQTGGALTGQRDAKTDYRKRRLSKHQQRRFRKRRRWNRKIVNVVRDANIGTSHLVRRSICQLSTAINLSDYVCYGLNGLDGEFGESFNTCNDIGEFFKEMDPAAWAGQNDPGVEVRNHKIYQYHGTAEYTIRNNNTAPDSEAVVEAYFIYGRKPVHRSYALHPGDVYGAGFRRQTTVTDPNTGNVFDGPLSAITVGVTPFQNAQFCRHFKIGKRQKYLIPPGGEVSFVINDRRRRVYSMDRCKDRSTDSNFIGVLFQQQGTPAAGFTPARLSQAISLTYLCIRRYRLKFMRDNLVMDALETSA